MEQGNEGDEILFFSCRQIGCEIPPSVKRVGDMTAELLIEVIAKSLILISNGEIQVSIDLSFSLRSSYVIFITTGFNAITC